MNARGTSSLPLLIFHNFILMTKSDLITWNTAIQDSKNNIRTKIIPLFVFAILASSLIANVDASSITPNTETVAGPFGNNGKIIDQEKLTKTETHKKIQVSIEEDVGISENRKSMISSFKGNDLRVVNRLYSKYGIRRNSRINQLLHQVSRIIVGQATKNQQSLVFEDIRHKKDVSKR